MSLIYLFKLSSPSSYVFLSSLNCWILFKQAPISGLGFLLTALLLRFLFLVRACLIIRLYEWIWWIKVLVRSDNFVLGVFKIKSNKFSPSSFNNSFYFSFKATESFSPLSTLWASNNIWIRSVYFIGFLYLPFTSFSPFLILRTVFRRILLNRFLVPFSDLYLLISYLPGI